MTHIPWNIVKLQFGPGRQQVVIEITESSSALLQLAKVRVLNDEAAVPYISCVPVCTSHMQAQKCSKCMVPTTPMPVLGKHACMYSNLYNYIYC